MFEYKFWLKMYKLLFLYFSWNTKFGFNFFLPRKINEIFENFIKVIITRDAYEDLH